MKQIIIGLLAIVILAGCQNYQHDYQQAENTISAENMRRLVKTLASDSFQGRMPCTIGEERTVEFLKNEFQQLGLKPAFNGSYFQDVPLVQIVTKPSEYLEIKQNSKSLKLKLFKDYVAFSMRVTDNIDLKDNNIVFVGYGVVAPEYNWNDYQGIDVKGKTVIVLVNDPGFGIQDSTLFKGKVMTYYGRWTYKFEEAAKQGAEACFIIHQTEGAGYPFAVPCNRANSANLYLESKDGYQSRCAVEGWIADGAANKLFSDLGFDLKSCIEKANRKDFKAFPLNATASMTIKSTYKTTTTKNVAAILEGTERADECIVYSAHWDHFGIGAVQNGDSIYRGAVDNGTSLAWMIDIAKAFSHLKNKPKRSIMFFAPTCEEQGLLGSGYYVEHPIFPMEKMVASINNDLMLPIGRMRDVMITGYGQSDLDDYAKEAALTQDRYTFPDPNPQTGMYFRSDHFSFAKFGVPALFARGNCDSREFGKKYAQEQEADYLTNKYHRPADKYDEKTWNFDGIVEDAKLLFKVGYKLSNESTFPKWKDGSEFKAKRK